MRLNRESILPFSPVLNRGRGWRFSANLCLCSSLPLSLNGPKGEGDQGGEGSPVGLGRIPSPKV